VSDFMQVIESYTSGVSTQRLFAGDGRNLSFSRDRRMQDKNYRTALVRFEEAYGNMIAGHRASHRFVRDLLYGESAAYGALNQGLALAESVFGRPVVVREAISTSDFPLLFGDTIDRVLLAKYKAHVPTWRDYVKVTAVSDFRDVKRFRCSPGRGLLPEIGQGGSYKSDKPSELHYSFAVKKHGGVRNIFWEALINDDLQALQDTPSDFAYQAQQTEAYQTTALFAANTTLYATNHTAEDGSTYSNKGTAVFDANALATAISTMGNYPGNDTDGLPVMNDPVYIVVATKEMQLKVDQVLNSLIVAYTGSTDETNLPTANIISQELRSRMRVRYNPYIRLLDTTNYATSWYLFADPADGYAVEMAFLRGYETPQMFMRASSQVLLGGGMASPMEGGFDNDSVDYKVRHVMGGSHTNAVGGWRFTYWSDGTV